MSKDEAAAPPEEVEKPSKFDSIAKVVTLTIAVFGVAQYVYDRVDARSNDKKSRSISYIEQYANADMLEARHTLADFWSRQQGLVGVFRNTSVTQRTYGALLDASVFRNDLDGGIQPALLKVDSFYTQVGFCRSSGLCEAKLLDAYFCETAQKYGFVYGPFYERISDRTGDTSVGRELQAYAGECHSKG
ncbi:hypothetical protein [Roseovarius sp. EL26]|uniref:hypothetical protein n=1 Tax=Roseovarius sp. EL26 TaxID=2126672 RepID=UPI0013C4F57B|nr:hypothetical protein [Roseovarius sp. EL26]